MLEKRTKGSANDDAVFQFYIIVIQPKDVYYGLLPARGTIGSMYDNILPSSFTILLSITYQMFSTIQYSHYKLKTLCYSSSRLPDDTGYRNIDASRQKYHDMMIHHYT